ncbi:MAG: sulfite exporter TauE/SafE family protein [Campylobacterales bacterium]|nr:sulfite exporter TauE/SafE family protein [Campylobacterales bacterium]
MFIELALLGIFVGIMSGFFGIGGGTVSVPILLYLGFDIKEAIAISVMQMAVSSVAGALIHRKKQTYALGDMQYFGYGGILGAMVGGYLVSVLQGAILGWIFLGLVVFTLVKLFLANPEPTHKEIVNYPLYLLIGTGVGVFSGMLGVGGSILMTPILVSFMGFPLKKASSVGLFYVMFTSISSFITLSWLGMMQYHAGAMMALGSLIGIWVGIWLLHQIKITHYKMTLVIFYVIILIITANKLLF